MARALLSALLLLGLACHCRAKQARAPRGKASHPSAKEAGAKHPSAEFWWPGLPGWGSKLSYHGGPLMTRPITVYLIWYGYWGENPGKSVLEGFINSVSSTEADDQGPSVRRWWETVARYTNHRGKHVTSNVKYGGAISVHEKPGSYRKHLRGDYSSANDDIFSIVTKAINSGKFPLDSNALYTVLTSKDVKVGSLVDGFCGTGDSVGCGWHNQRSLQGRAVNYAFVGDPTGTAKCALACGNLGGDYNETANGFPSVDSFIDTFAHELAEAATDPATDPAFDPKGNQTGYWASGAATYENVGENGDICANTYTDDAHPSPLTDDAQTYQYNLVGVDGLKFLVQVIPDVETQRCLLQAPPVTSAAASASGGR